MPDDNTVDPLGRFHRWFGQRARATDYAVRETPLGALDGWRVDRSTGDIVHRTGRFYTVEGLRVTALDGTERSWSQPIIRQPEIGILGLLVKEFDGVPHLLMQAKMEPGNINTLQLSPTVQATHSNYTRVHQGNPVPYVEYFTVPGRGRPLADALQSEQGSWFLGKRNRNIIVETTEEVPLLDGFHWLSLAELDALLRLDNVVNMDSRSVLAAYPAPPRAAVADEDSFRGALARSAAAPADRTDLLSRFTAAKAARSLTRERVPLNDLPGWHDDSGRVVREDGRYFAILGVDVEAADREVPRWSQPLLAPVGRGVIALLTRRVDGVLHLLLRARTEAGTFDVAELGPTVQCVPENYQEPEASQPPFLDYVLSLPQDQVRFDAVHSEEGGRFYHAENRYLVVEADDDFPLELPDGYLWATLRDMTELVRHSHYLNVEARCLLACLNTLR
ncbi:NDP-hexose 2,3-dehydratase family protein [Kitasatospora sp. NBC_01250]|uniref:NDP-hexose 2,3-dehydratase family protein n=1 Tax=Kitasatospora sp. NBC_01250 TaxID=2903571 RepID=UPI002E31ADA6|nr:NDP-hexose 2,3-dehydratase family protein [Kitasatospora sp. NBC_01250]